MSTTEVDKGAVVGLILNISSDAPYSFPRWKNTNLDLELRKLSERIAAYRKGAGKRKKQIDYGEIEALIQRSRVFYIAGDREWGAKTLECARHCFEGTRHVIEDWLVESENRSRTVETTRLAKAKFFVLSLVTRYASRAR